jgi:transposase-like protein
MDLPQPHRPQWEKLDHIGIDIICDMIESGKSYRDIARKIGCSDATVSNWLNFDEERAKRSACARLISAESWLDNGIDVLRDALSKNSDIDATAARAFEQACARRAAIRNPKYSEKLVHAGDAENPIAIAVSQRPQLARDEWLQLHGIVAEPENT